MDLGAEKIEVVGDFGRFGIPRFPGGRTGRWRTAASRRGGRRNAEAKESPRPFGTRGNFRRAEVTVNCGGSRLRRGDPNGCDQHKRLHLISYPRGLQERPKSSWLEN